jgi:tetratricopeptide (TPR) repeat protein
MEREPGNPIHHYLAGIARARLDRYEEADSLLTRAEEIYPAYELEVEPVRRSTWAEAFNEGTEAWADGDVERAIEAWRGAATMYALEPRAHQSLASALVREGRRQEAIEVYREALKANTDAVYDILQVVATESGASYDTLEERTGLARSTIRYHVKRLQESGVVERVSNPLLVLFPSLAALENAKEILRTIYPDDQVDDMIDRAEERRERREERDDPSAVGDDDRDDVDQEDDAGDGDRGRSSEWAYFEDLRLEAHQLASALEKEYLEGDEVRVRTDRHSWVE